MSVAVLVQWSLLARVFKTPGNPENLLELLLEILELSCNLVVAPRQVYN